MPSLPLETIILDSQEFAFLTGLQFRGLSITEAPGTFNITLRAYTKDNTPVYCLTRDPEPLVGLARLVEVFSSRSSSRLWAMDRFAR